MTPPTSKGAAAPQMTSVDTGSLERPVGIGTNAPLFGSDVVAESLRALDIPYIALNPGASYRGLHDSIVNYLGNKTPQMLLCLHEEAAVAIAHGYAKVTDKAMAAAVHSNVGLFHATMAVFDAWCDRAPVLLLGATGPVDAAKRRPWIDWIHTAADQGAIVRNYTKWDDQPASPAAAQESLMRAAWMANTLPQGPVYVNLDAEMQEMKLPEPLPPVDVKRFTAAVATGMSEDTLKKVVALLKSAKNPVIMMGRGSRDVGHWNARVALAEAINAKVTTKSGPAAVFPTHHPLHIGAPTGLGPSKEVVEALQQADVILCLEYLDVGGTFQALGGAPKGTVINVSMDYQVHNGWSMDYHKLPTVDLMVAADSDVAVAQIVAALGAKAKAAVTPRPTSVPQLAEDKLYVAHIAQSLRKAVGTRDTCLAYLPISWDGNWWPYNHPLDYTGSSGGGGVGAGPGITVGVALALKGTGRLPVALVGDGDFMMGCTAIWTAAHYRVPLLMICCNNRSFYNDEVHQERVARMRKRPVENKWIGQRINDPDIDIAAMAQAQGARGFGPVTKVSDLDKVIAEAVAAVDAGHVAVVDVRIEPGYLEEVSSAMLRKTE